SIAGADRRYRLLALDLDGTIVGLDLSVDPRDEAALAAARGRGLKVAACTGRPYSGAVHWVERFQLTEPVICYQGAQVRAADGSLLLDHGIPHALAMEVIGFARAAHLPGDDGAGGGQGHRPRVPGREAGRAPG